LHAVSFRHFIISEKEFPVFSQREKDTRSW
jgi:hypothetical protein